MTRRRTSERKEVEPTQADLEWALACIVQDFDPLAAKNLVHHFYKKLDTGAVLDRNLREYLRHVFGKIVQYGWTADQAMGFKRRRGQREREYTFERDLLAAAWVELAVRKGKTLSKAKGEATDKLFEKDKGDRAIDKARNKYGATVALLPDSTLEEFAKHTEARRPPK